MKANPRSPQRLAVVVLLAAAFSGCGQQQAQVDSRSVDELERFLSGSAEEFERTLDVAELVTECARYNGLSGYIERLPEQQSAAVAVEDAAEFAREFGTGFVELQRQMQELEPEMPLEQEGNATGSEEVESRILNSGPILDPSTGEQLGTGCRAWANEQVPYSVDPQAVRELAEDYAAYMDERFFASAEYAELEVQQFDCLDAEGYGDIRSIEDLNEVVFAAAGAWQAGEITFEEALEIDRRHGWAYFKCRELIQPEVNRLRVLVVAQYLEENGEALAGLSFGAD